MYDGYRCFEDHSIRKMLDFGKKDQSPKKEETRDQGCFLGVNPYNFSYSYEEKEYIEKPFKREQLAGVKL